MGERDAKFGRSTSGRVVAWGLLGFGALAAQACTGSGDATTVPSQISTGSGPTTSGGGSTAVPCTPGEKGCAAGEYCSDAGVCTDGCDEANPCASGKCDPAKNLCVQCLDGSDCEEGTHCVDGTCVAGCSDAMDCSKADQCCDGGCVDTQTSMDHCGMCGTPCVVPPNAKAACQAGMCEFLGCKSGFADCDLDAKNGCEQNLSKGECACTPGEQKDCYSGLAVTKDVGLCKGGKSTCNAAGTGWGPCVGEVTPTAEVCGNGLDDDCTGGADDPPDVDGDGWNRCQGDCCELMQDCTAPKLVNPGAFEVDGNTLDDDCDGKADNPVATCDKGLASNSATASDYAKAIDICQTTTESPALPQQKKWGLISASFSRADGSGTPAVNSRSIRGGFGSGVIPFAGDALAVLSTGVAAAKDAPNNVSPSWAAFQGGQSMGTTSGVPADWLAANKGSFPNAPGCPAPFGGTTANDPIQLKLRVRVPTNAKSFSVSSFFYSSEYPEFVCSEWNDFFLALLDSKFSPMQGQDPNPADKNLAIYKSGNLSYPLGVNLAFGNTGLFKQCLNGSTGCASGSVAGTTNKCVGTTMLAGTGFDAVNPPAQYLGDPGYCGTNNLAGGGTGWLSISGNVAAGETIELRFVLWDTGDAYYDSLVLLDNFEWSVDAAQPGVHDG